MKIPYCLKGALFAPALVILIFVLKVTCPAGAGAACFADPFISSVFLPLPSIYKIFGQQVFIMTHEPLFILIYWILIGFFVGFFVDIYKVETGN